MTKQIVSQQKTGSDLIKKFQYFPSLITNCKYSLCKPHKKETSNMLTKWENTFSKASHVTHAAQVACTAKALKIIPGVCTPKAGT